MNILVQLVSVLSDREFLVVVDRNVNFFSADRFFVWVVELGYVRMLQCLISCQPFVGVELKKIFEQVKGFRRSSWEHVFEFPWLGWWKTFKHGLSNGTVDAVHVFLTWSASHFHDSVQLVECGSPWEYWFAKKQFRQNASHAPHVCSFGVLVGPK